MLPLLSWCPDTDSFYCHILIFRPITDIWLWQPSCKTCFLFWDFFVLLKTPFYFKVTMWIRYKSQDFISFSTGSWYSSFVLLMALFLLDYYYYSEYLTHLCSQGDPIQPLASCEAPAGYSFLFSRPLFPLCWPQLQFQIASSCQIFFSLSSSPSSHPFFCHLFSCSRQMIVIEEHKGVFRDLTPSTRGGEKQNTFF